MGRAHSDPAEIVEAVLHELRSRVGAVRLAVNALEESARDGAARESTLRTADRETLRISTEMSAVGALVRCLMDRSKLGRVDVARSLKAAASDARHAGTRVSIRGDGHALVRGRSASLEAGLAAIVQLVADGTGEVVARAAREGSAVVVQISRTDGHHPLEAGPKLVGAVIEAVGGTLVASDDGLSFRLPGAGP